MRRAMRVLIFLVGGLLGVAGLAAAIVAGPDDTVSSGNQELATDTAAITVAPSLLDFTGPTLHVSARSLSERDVFVGIGHLVDVDAYLDDVAHEQITQLRFPLSFDLDPVPGASPAASVPPVPLDWWLDESSGLERQDVSHQLDADPVTAVIMSADGEPLVVAEVEFGLEVENLFTTALVALAAGIALSVVGVAALRKPRGRFSAEHHGRVLDGGAGHSEEDWLTSLNEGDDDTTREGRL